MSSGALAAVLAEVLDWPGVSFIRLHYEQALVREAAPDAKVIAAFAKTDPVTSEGLLLLAHALSDAGRTSDAARVVREFWRTEDLSEAGEKSILAAYANVLTTADHQARVDRLLDEGQATAALRTAKLLDAGHAALAQARAAVINGSGSQGRLLDAVPADLRTDPAYILAKAQYLRRAKNYAAAANLILAAPTDPALLADPDAWSEERQELARRFIDIGDPWTAYSLVAGARAVSQTAKVEAEFDAGWYALDYLHQPTFARPHFQAILDRSNTPISQARGNYWLGRVAEAQGDRTTANQRYALAAAIPIAFYGQMAADRLNAAKLQLAPPPAPDAATVARFSSRELVQALVALEPSGSDDLVDLLYNRLAATLSDPAEFALLAAVANDARHYSLVVEVGKAAQGKGLAVGSLGFPVNALPPYPGPSRIEGNVLYAIARQESEFDPGDVSSAGAVGMFQVIPQYAKETADKAGIPYLKNKVKTDAVYNMQLGAAELSGLIDTYGGSYLLAFAAYNAGPAPVAAWIAENGDPRSGKVDVLDWIERIPYDETRNYVQRVLENLGVYRALRGDPTLRIAADLRGGAHGGDVATEAERGPAPGRTDAPAG
jgi:soluble lytic murein transglycosylase